jgi:hypothetical protein
MTGYTVHTGASKKFVSGWDKVFGGKTEKTATGAIAKGKSGGTDGGKKAAKGKKKK